MFREQVNTISSMFEQWNECEQTVVLYALLKRMSPIKARFLAVALDQSLANCVELQLQEHQANNPGFVSSLLAESKEVALAQLLLHLPLLRPGNCEAKTRYLSVIHKVLSHSVETGTHTEESQQLLSYSLIHPAITSEDRSSLTYWVRHLEDRITTGNSRKSARNSSSTDSPQHSRGGTWGPTQHHYQSPRDNQFTQNCSTSPSMNSQANMNNAANGSQPRVRRSNSLTPPVSITQSSEIWSSQDDLSGRQKARSFSLSSENAPPLSPQNSLTSSGSGSETHLDDLRAFTSDACGMKDVPTWLKSLRLHKYAWLFAQLSYEEMLSLTEEQLAAHGITKGACHKIVLSIRKLRERYPTLLQLEKDAPTVGNINTVLEELKAIIISPIKALNAHDEERDETDSQQATGNIETNGKINASHTGDLISSLPEEDIPAQFTKVMGKVSALLITNAWPDEECMNTFLSISDHALQHEAFSSQQKNFLASWKLQVQQKLEQKQSRQQNSRWYGHSQLAATTTASTNTTIGLQCTASSTSRHTRFPPSPTAPSHFQPRNSPNTTAMASGFSSVFTQHHRNSFSIVGPPPTGAVGTSSFMAKRPSLQDPLPDTLQPHNSLQRTRSAPPKPNQLCGPNFGAATDPLMVGDPEINSQLESLSLRMTEIALAGSNEQ